MKKIIKKIDSDLDKLVHISKLNSVNLDYFLKNKNYDQILIDKSKKEIKYIKDPDFKIKTYRNLNSKGILKCFHPIEYDMTYGAIGFDFTSSIDIKNDFIGTKIYRLKLSDNIYRYYLETFYVDCNEFKKIYNGLLKYLHSEKGFYRFNSQDLNYLFINALGLYCKNHSDELEKIVNLGINYITFSAFLNDHKIYALNETIKALNKNHKTWKSFNTYVDNRALDNNKILTLKKQQKLN